MIFQHHPKNASRYHNNDSVNCQCYHVTLHLNGSQVLSNKALADICNHVTHEFLHPFELERNHVTILQIPIFLSFFRRSIFCDNHDGFVANDTRVPSLSSCNRDPSFSFSGISWNWHDYLLCDTLLFRSSADDRHCKDLEEKALRNAHTDVSLIVVSFFLPICWLKK